MKVYLTQSKFDALPNDTKTESHLINIYEGETIPYTIIGPRKTLLCCSCGVDTKGRQWYNRDKGYGVCTRCYLKEYDRAMNNGSMNDDLSDLRSNYGIYGIHCGELSDFIIDTGSSIITRQP